jgi:hypothetical protein
MSIRDESTSSNEILRDARFHRAALHSDSEAKHLVDAVAKSMDALKKRRNASEDAEEQRIDALAALLRVDFDLDEQIRGLELEVLGAVSKNRADAGYKAIFPRGLSSLVGLRGEDEAREVRAMLPKLKEHFPKLAKAREADLEKLAASSIAAEKAWKDAETQAAHVFADEVIARTELVRQLQKNEGALVALYPGQKGKVRSYFRPTRRRGAATPGGDAPAATGGG